MQDLTDSQIKRRRKRVQAKEKYGCTLKVLKASQKRQAKFFGDHLWLVWGGKGQHVVYFGPTRVECDCHSQWQAYNRTCCHVQAIKNHLMQNGL